MTPCLQDETTTGEKLLVKQFTEVWNAQSTETKSKLEEFEAEYGSIDQLPVWTRVLMDRIKPAIE